MKYVRFEHEGSVAIGRLDGSAVIPLVDDNHQPFRCLRKLIEMIVDGDPASRSTRPVPVAHVRLLAPIARPEKIFCIGLNYADHAAETKATVGEWPVVFSKFSSALIGPGDPIRLPAISQQIDFEAELVLVVGKGGRNIPRAAAGDHIFGYCCGNDVSARDWQKGRPGGQWLLGKTIDTFAPLGPAITTADEIGWPPQLDIRLRLNGHLMQDSNTRHFIFPPDILLAHLSQFCCLRPGDLIFTGTPSGVGFARTPPIFLKPGDIVAVEIEQLGELSNPVAAS
jgi:2-keto-4-pentenoate hydratase/2-oxohepta-3-ene-1,7-dioic acid hydratase in catechol pathway